MKQTTSTRALAMALLALLAATSAAPRGTAMAQTLPTVRVMAGMTETSADAYYAQEMGFFRRAGLNVELQQGRSGNVAAAAVASNAVEIADGNIISIAQGRVRGLPFVAIAPGQNYDTSDPLAVLAVLPNSTYRTAKDLNGTTLGIISVGSIADLGVKVWLERNGGDIASIKLVELTPAEMVPALEQGRVSAAVVSDPQLSAERSRIRVIGKLYDAIAPRFMLTLWFTTSEWAAKNPDLVRRFAEALNAADEWADKNVPQAEAVMEKWLKTKVTHMKHFHSKTLEPAMVQPLLDDAAKYKIIPRPLNMTEFVWSGK